jgi:hypothetical protein
MERVDINVAQNTILTKVLFACRVATEDLDYYEDPSEALLLNLSELKQESDESNSNGYNNDKTNMFNLGMGHTTDRTFRKGCIESRTK